MLKAVNNRFQYLGFYSVSPELGNLFEPEPGRTRELEVGLPGSTQVSGPDSGVVHKISGLGFTDIRKIRYPVSRVLPEGWAR